MDVMLWTATAALLIAGVAMVVLAALKAWQGWLDLKRFELSGRHPGAGAERIEIADLKERIRKLEAIAACVDL